YNINTIKVFLIFSSILLIFCDFFIKNDEIFAKTCENQDFEVEHFFTHCLIVKPEIAFNKNNFMAKDYDKDCLTSSEFYNILNALYENNYCLIDIHECYKINDNGKAIKQKVELPNGKKPFILSIDDVNYDSKKMHLGMCDKICMDKNGKLCSMIDGKLDYKREFVSVLNNFIEAHNDFSYHNAKAMLCLTGYDGILGYRTQNGDKNEINNAKRVVETLKNNGYYFACHSYGHYHMKKINVDKFENELESWKKEVEPLIGKTDIYVYPYGENEIIKDGKISEKHKILTNNGFKMFCGVGARHFYSYYPFNETKENQVLFMDRHPLDGYSLREHKGIYNEYFDCASIYDKKNRTVNFN
ncbi:MAG: hypothetical protein KBT30_02965, partial [Clostridiales bacterium]|nr:hypothetical protein [Candidatus Apopatousia equi]